jgi:hypothetical protein
MGAIKELADRLDGRPVQAITGPEGEQITVVQRVIVQHVVEEEGAPVISNPKLIN